LGNLTIVEIKRGILRRDALGQAMEYYGLLRKKEPNKEIRLMLVANVIPEGMTAFLNEKLGVEFLEIPVSKIHQVAGKHSYHFLDSEQPKLVKEYKQTIQKMNFEADTAQPAVWIFQANPQRYDVLNALADESLTDDVWLVSRYQNYIHAGHIGLIWMSGKEGGIYSVVDVTSNPQMMYDSEQSTKYWLSESDQKQMMLRVKIRYKLKLINNPILKQELKNEPELQNMEIFRRPIGTNFKVTNNEWQTILQMLKKRFEFKE
jgi:predicted RNA-binding protein with PUA-like domain